MIGADTVVRFDLPAFIAGLTALVTALGVLIAQLVKLRGSVAQVHADVAETKAVVVNGTPPGGVPAVVPPAGPAP